MPQSAFATAADNAEALIVARRAKNRLVFILACVVLIQLAIYFYVHLDPAVIAMAGPTAAHPTIKSVRLFRCLRYVIGITDFLGIALALVLAAVLFLIANIMLIGRLIGVGRLTAAYVWCLVLLVLFFPWQAFLNNPSLNTPALPPALATTTPSVMIAPAPSAEPDFKVPGALYTWSELTQDATAPPLRIDVQPRYLRRWARFIGFPLVSLCCLFMIQHKSRRGIRLALGEADPGIIHTLSDID